MKRAFLILYTVLLAVVMVAASDYALIHLFTWTKPLLMGSLILFTVLSLPGLQHRNLIPWLLLALLFSLLGDVLLLPSFGASYFLFGLISFLAAHVLYIVAFLKTPARPLEVSFIRRNPWVIFLVILYGGWMFIRLKSGAAELAPAVAVYILVISTMLLTALNRQGTVSSRSFYPVALGALLFIVSDSVLAWNRFVDETPLAAALILGSYGLAQLLIVLGLLKQCEETL